MIAWRICKHKYADRAAVLRADGARILGARWNHTGLPLVYASSSSSLAVLETLVYTDIRTLPRSLGVVSITIPDDVVRDSIRATDLHVNWRDVNDVQCAQLGSAWIQRGKALVLEVPSAVNPLEANILLNPAHSDIERCDIGDFIPISLDPRLLRLF